MIDKRVDKQLKTNKLKSTKCCKSDIYIITKLKIYVSINRTNK